MIIFDVEELKKPSEPVSVEDAVSIIALLEYELGFHPGVGLAAPQVGIHKRVAIIRYGEDKLDLVNPVIVECKGEVISKNEGCLSFPNKKFNVWRYREVFVKDALHPEGVVVTDIMATIVLHEVDHLNGVLFMDKAVGGWIGRNDPCPCGKLKEGKAVKFKNCHGR